MVVAKAAMVFRIANRAMMLVFGLAAVVQFNDPDPLIWMAIYSGTALICIASEKDRLHWLIAGTLAGGFLAGGVLIARQVPSGSPWFDNESAREAMGLFLCSFWMTVLTWRALQSPAARSSL